MVKSDTKSLITENNTRQFILDEVNQFFKIKSIKMNKFFFSESKTESCSDAKKSEEVDIDVTFERNLNRID